jgi:hypothetical protein
MLDVGTKSGEMMIVLKDFKVVHVECLWVWMSIRNRQKIYWFD